MRNRLICKHNSYQNIAHKTARRHSGFIFIIDYFGIELAIDSFKWMSDRDCRTFNNFNASAVCQPASTIMAYYIRRKVLQNRLIRVLYHIAKINRYWLKQHSNKSNQRLLETWKSLQSQTQEDALKDLGSSMQREHL